MFVQRRMIAMHLHQRPHQRVKFTGRAVHRLQLEIHFQSLTRGFIHQRFYCCVTVSFAARPADTDDTDAGSFHLRHVTADHRRIVTAVGATKRKEIGADVVAAGKFFPPGQRLITERQHRMIPVRPLAIDGRRAIPAVVERMQLFIATHCRCPCQH